MKKFLIITTIFTILVGVKSPTAFAISDVRFWDVQSIDTMKYSRDIAREKLNDKSFDIVIDRQVKDIANTGATHIAIATPYDSEFLPFLKRWVAAARRYHLKVWFRGNWSGWEGWFNYPKITRADHITKTQEFILKNKNLFEDGDIFTACPECENGGPGDPRHNNDLKEYRKFLIDEYSITKKAFDKIGKQVISNYNSMNGDVARLVMDKKTTTSLDGIVAIDHYVKTKERLISDIKQIADESGGKIVLAEFGAPIPDINGALTEKAQAQWIYGSLNEVAKLDQVAAVNYWVNIGGSTELWSENGRAKLAVSTLSKIYKPYSVSAFLANSFGRPVEGAKIKNMYKEILSDKNGYFELPYLDNSGTKISISANGYISKDIAVDLKVSPMIITLQELKLSFMSKILLKLKFLGSLWHLISN